MLPRSCYETEKFVLRLNSYTAGANQQPHFHDRSSVSFVLSGQIEETVGCQMKYGATLSTVIKPAGVIHADRYANGDTRVLQIELKSEELWKPDQSWRWYRGGNSARSFLTLLRLLLKNSTEEAIDVAGVRVLTSLPPLISPARVPLWLKKARAIILSSSMRNVLPVHRVAALVGVHPVYLTRKFRRHFGETIRNLVSRRRVHLAARLLAESAGPLAGIAWDLGYSDQAHFCRQFRKATGFRPSEFRSMVGNVQY